MASCTRINEATKDLTDIFTDGEKERVMNEEDRAIRVKGNLVLKMLEKRSWQRAKDGEHAGDLSYWDGWNDAVKEIRGILYGAQESK
jgi:hypothetical protein